MKIADNILSTIYPRKCIVCQKLIGIDKYVCDRCLDGFIYLDTAFCAHCGKNYDRCECCFSFVRSISPFEYTMSGKACIMSLKFKGNKNAAKYLARFMVESLLQVYSKEDFDIISYVPAKKTKLKKKGFNQAAWLAKYVAKVLKLPIDNHMLIRTESSLTQHTLSTQKRKENAKLSYQIIKPPKAGSRILLIDDIITTGATLDSISRLFIENGAEYVVALTAASTKLKA